jgi:putative intracellular protease/amidase
VRVLVPLPDRDFDVTEVAVPWRILRDAGHQVVFATERAGTLPAADPRLLAGVLFGQMGAAPQAKDFYSELTTAPEFTSTQAWAELEPAGFDGLLLPGGHAAGMRQYLGSAVLREQVARFWALGRPVGAICHGVLVLARTRDTSTGRSVLAGWRTTCLPKYADHLPAQVRGPPACPSTWSALPTWRPPGAWAATTGPTRPTSRTRSKLPWTTRAASSSEGQ